MKKSEKNKCDPEKAMILKNTRWKREKEILQWDRKVCEESFRWFPIDDSLWMEKRTESLCGSIGGTIPFRMGSSGELHEMGMMRIQV